MKIQHQIFIRVRVGGGGSTPGRGSE